MVNSTKPNCDRFAPERKTLVSQAMILFTDTDLSARKGQLVALRARLAPELPRFFKLLGIRGVSLRLYGQSGQR